MNTEKTYQSQYFPGLHATANAWQSIGYHIVGNPEDWAGNEARPDYHDNVPSAIVRLALGLHDKTDAALYWAAQEWQRRKEEQTRSTAEARSAESIAALAVALRSAGQQTALEQVIGQLSERTQYAVRAQLKGSSLPQDGE